MFDGESLGRQLAEKVRDLVERATEPLRKRLDAVEQRPAPVSVTNAMIDRNGNLVLTHSDGSTKDLGQVTRDGKNGADGLGFDDLDVTHDGERGFTLRFQRGDQVKEFTISVPVLLDRGVWAEGNEYVRGDGVTWGGSFWIAQKDAPEKPDTADSGWRLAVKKGQNGKDLTK